MRNFKAGNYIAIYGKTYHYFCHANMCNAIKIARDWGRNCIHRKVIQWVEVSDKMFLGLTVWEEYDYINGKR